MGLVLELMVSWMAVDFTMGMTLLVNKIVACICFTEWFTCCFIVYGIVLCWEFVAEAHFLWTCVGVLFVASCVLDMYYATWKFIVLFFNILFNLLGVFAGMWDWIFIHAEIASLFFSFFLFFHFSIRVFSRSSSPHNFENFVVLLFLDESLLFKLMSSLLIDKESWRMFFSENLFDVGMFSPFPFNY